MKHKIACVVGARPNFMKMAPLIEALQAYPEQLDLGLVHTGQHYDQRLSGLLFEQLELPDPDVYLDSGSGSLAEQTGRVMVAFEDYCQDEKPDLVLVVGDVNSTLACALSGSKAGIPVAHVESGLRSRDRTMPEEINRAVTDSVSDLLFTTCREADDNLIAEGISREKIHFVGNVMIDSLKKFLPKSRRPPILDRLGDSDPFGIITLHRPANVDHPDILRSFVNTFQELSENLPLIFPTHPRTAKQLREIGYEEIVDLNERGVTLGNSEVWLAPPLGYLEFIYLLNRATLVLSDSGGIQEEATVLGTPCLTLRENTERPITLEMGANVLVGRDPQVIRENFMRVLGNGRRDPIIPEKWDGGSSEEIARILVEWLPKHSK